MPMIARSALGAVLLAAAGISAAMPAWAQEQQTQELDGQPAYEDLFEATFDRPESERIAFESIMEGVAQSYRASPDWQALEDRNPGITEQAIRGVEPVFRDYMERVFDEYRPKQIAIYAEHLTPAEAREIAIFYRSPLGQRVQEAPAADVDMVSRFAAADAAGERAGEEIDATFGAVRASVMAELSQDDRDAITRAIESSAALRKLGPVNEAVFALHYAMTREPLNEAEQARVQQVVDAVAARNL
jgi:hypothetical protein